MALERLTPTKAHLGDRVAVLSPSFVAPGARTTLQSATHFRDGATPSKLSARPAATRVA